MTEKKKDILTGNVNKSQQISFFAYLFSFHKHDGKSLTKVFRRK